MLKSGEFGDAEIFHGQWIRFKDSLGFGHAQPDHYVVMSDRVLLFEDKLSQTVEARAQCLGLYVPLLQFIYKRPVCAIQVFKNWRYTTVCLDHPLQATPGELHHWNMRADR